MCVNCERWNLRSNTKQQKTSRFWFQFLCRFVARKSINNIFFNLNKILCVTASVCEAVQGPRTRSVVSSSSFGARASHQCRNIWSASLKTSHKKKEGRKNPQKKSHKGNPWKNIPSFLQMYMFKKDTTPVAQNYGWFFLSVVGKCAHYGLYRT